MLKLNILAGLILLTLFVLLTLSILLSYQYPKKLNNEMEYSSESADRRYYKPSNKEGWHTIELGIFSIELPTRYTFHRLNTIDGYGGKILNRDGEGYLFSYGMYNLNLEKYYSDATLTISIDTITDYYARSAIPKNSGRSAVFITNITTGMHLVIKGEGLSNKDAKYAFSSIIILNNFEGYTSKNFGENIVEDSVRIPEETLLKDNCTPCHNHYRKSFSEVSVLTMCDYSFERLKKIVTKGLQNNSQLNFDHKFNYLSEEEINRLILYIKSMKRE